MALVVLEPGQEQASGKSGRCGKHLSLVPAARMAAVLGPMLECLRNQKQDTACGSSSGE